MDDKKLAVEAVEEALKRLKDEGSLATSTSPMRVLKTNVAPGMAHSRHPITVTNFEGEKLSPAEWHRLKKGSKKLRKAQSVA